MHQGRDRGLGCPWLKCFTSAEHTATRRGAATPPGSGKGPPRGTRPGTPLCPAVLPLDGPPRTAGFGETEQNPSRPGCAWLPSLLPPQFLIVQKLQLTARWPRRRRVVSPVHQSCSINQSAHVRVTAVSGGPRLGTGWRSDPSPAPASECHAWVQLPIGRPFTASARGGPLRMVLSRGDVAPRAHWQHLGTFGLS